MARWIEGEVVDNRHWTDTLYSLRVKAPIEPFVAGQFGRLALEIDGKPHGRPYSFVNAPHEEILEFYSIVVPEGPLSPRLELLEAGDRVLVGPKGAGFFTLEQVPDADTLWMLATGTALGPFLSMLKTEAPWQRFRNLVLSHAVRHAEELTYRDTIRGFRERDPARFKYVPFVSRKASGIALPGRVTTAIESGLLQRHTSLPMTPADSQVMLCGNPDMVRDSQNLLAGRGFEPNTRKQKGRVTTENYW
jgi:ferredoxin--NADP+ reductase